MKHKNSDKSVSYCIYSALANNIRQFTGWIFISLLLMLFSTVIFPSKSYAVPAYEGFAELKQPSGYSFEARQFGDEWYNYVETKDGYGVYKNTITNVWEYYLSSVDTNSGKDGSKGRTGRNRKARRGKHGDSTEASSNASIGRVQDSPFRIIVGEADPIALGIPKGLRPPKTLGQSAFPQGLQTEMESEGGLKAAAIRGAKPLLVIGVDYADAPAIYTAGQIQPLLFGTSNSVSDYYSKTSYSSVTITMPTESHGTSTDGFIGWLRLNGNHPNTGSGGWNNPANKQIAKDAILAADPYINFAQYDTNGNGVVEPTELSVMIIVAGYEASYIPHGSPSVWAHYWNMDSIGYPMVDGKTIQQYAMFGEKHDNHLATFGVMAHELGHLMFGLPDLYDTDTSNGDSEGIGFFDLMGGGSWGAVSGAHGGSSPTQLSAWSKEYLSWGIVNNISASQRVYFPKTDGNSSSVSRINTADANQYFLIENRQFTGYDRGFEGATGALGHGGLVIYHIDKLKTPPQNWLVNADENDKGVDVEEANEGSLGYSMLDTKISAAHTNMFFFAGNNASFTNSTTPGSKLKNGNATFISITDISNYGDTMAATVDVAQEETISTPNTPSGPTSGTVGASYTYTTGGATSNLGHSLEYRFNFGDGTYSIWSSSSTASKSWSSSGTYAVKAQARCATHTDKVSGESSGLSVAISGSDIVQLTVNASPVTGNISTAGEVDWYKFIVPSQGSYTIETWAGTLTDNYMYLYGPNSQTTLIEEDDDDGTGNAALIGPRTLSTGTYYVKVKAYSSSGTGTYTISVVNSQDESVSIPNTPSGPTSGVAGTSYTYTTGGATSSLGHSVEYRFNWGDGTYSSWSSLTTASKSWSSSGTYVVKAQARCATHTDKVSGESSGLSVAISGSDIVQLTVNASPVTGNISTAGEVDWYKFIVPSQGSYKIETWAGTLADNYMYLYGPNSQTTLIEEDDDDGTGNAALIGPRTLSAGIYYVKVKAYSTSGTGTYTISVVNSQDESVSIPNTPSGPTSGVAGTSYTYTTGGATSSLGHSVEYRFNWGDGTYSSWSSLTTASKSWSSLGTYAVKAQARCATHTDKVSSESSGLSVAITQSESEIVQLTVNASPLTGNISTAGEVDWYKFTVPSQGSYKIETWAGTLADNYMYLYGPNSQTTLIEEDDDDGTGNAALIGPRTLSTGTYYVKVKAYYSTYTGTYTISVVNSQDEVVSIPNTPSGPVSGTVGASYTYTTGGATSSLGHSVEYRFNWGDGTYSSWSSLTTASKSWSSSGTYVVKAQARCATHTDKVSGESSGLSVAISGSDIVQLTVNASPVTGNISTSGEMDWYKFTVPSQGSYTIETWAGTLTDNYMYLYGPNSQTTFIEADDDDGIGNAALIGPRTLSTGTYYLKVKAYRVTGRGTYTIQVRR